MIFGKLLKKVGAICLVPIKSFFLYLELSLSRTNTLVPWTFRSWNPQDSSLALKLRVKTLPFQPKLEHLQILTNGFLNFTGNLLYVKNIMTIIVTVFYEGNGRKWTRKTGGGGTCKETQKKEKKFVRVAAFIWYINWHSATQEYEDQI